MRLLQDNSGKGAERIEQMRKTGGEGKGGGGGGGQRSVREDPKLQLFATRIRGRGAREIRGVGAQQLRKEEEKQRRRLDSSYCGCCARARQRSGKI